MRLGAAIMAVLALTSGCAAETSEDGGDVSSDEGAINGGQTEVGYPQVGLVTIPPNFVGSGTLIGPSTVLTAGHVANAHAATFSYGTPAPGKPASRPNLHDVAVKDFVIHPCYLKPVLCNGDKVDVAILHLAEPVRDVAPMPVVDAPLEYFWGLLSPYEGESCKAVGFGGHIETTGHVSFAARRSAAITIEAVNDVEINTVWGSGIATGGDSGGPLVCNGKIIGTVRGSAGPVPTWSPLTRVREAYIRSDRYRDWIRAQIR
jgi:hypothetical protein